MRYISTLILVLIMYFSLFSTTQAGEHKHVRVVLDTSMSLSRTNAKYPTWPNDAGRMAILSTILLYDLFYYAVDSNDTFKVLPFDKNWPSKVDNIKSIKSRRNMIEAKYGKRSDFVKEMHNLKNNSKNTYFYPGLKKAINSLSLSNAEGGKFATRVIVLVTDGLPEEWAKQQEIDAIHEDLTPLLERNGINLYVLAFGEQASSHPYFFERMITANDGSSKLGAYITVPNIEKAKLLQGMTEIFSRSFGYSFESPKELGMTKQLDLNLEGGSSPGRVAVVVFSPQAPPPVPSLSLDGPPINLPMPPQSEPEKGASYTVQWGLGPSAGMYNLETNIFNTSVVVLRPVKLGMELRKAGSKDKLLRLMSAPNGAAFDILIKPPLGTHTDPGQAHIDFRPIIKPSNMKKRLTCDEKYVWCGASSSRKNDSGVYTPGSDGRIYQAKVQFIENPISPRKKYFGHIEVTAKKNEAIITSLTGINAYPVEVYPYLHLQPFAPNWSVEHVLKKGDKQLCKQATFTFNKQGYLPERSPAKYSLRAVLAPGKQLMERELYQAEFTLDGIPLEFESQTTKTGDWHKGRPLSEDELLGEHEVCVQIGKPKAFSSSTPFSVPIKFTLVESPYDDFDVIDDFIINMEVTPPLVLSPKALLILGITLLLLLIRLLRNPPDLPTDLTYSFAILPKHKGVDTLSPNLSPATLGEGSPIARLLGSRVDKPITIDNGSQILAWIRPVKDNETLFCLWLAEDVVIRTVSGTDDTFETEKNCFDVQVGRIYRLTDKNNDYLFRLEYRMDWNKGAELETTPAKT